MPEIFGFDIADIVADGLELAGGLLPATFQKRVTGPRGADSTAGLPTSWTPYDCTGIVTDFENAAIDGTLIVRGDRQVMLVARELPVDPLPDDRVTIEGTTYTLVRLVSRDPARATFTFSCRGVP